MDGVGTGRYLQGGGVKNREGGVWVTLCSSKGWLLAKREG